MLFLACAIAPGAPAQLPNRALAEIPFRDVVGHIFVSGSINSAPTVSLIVDSGSPDSMLSSQLFERLKLSRASGATQLPGYGEQGATESFTATVQTLRLGDLTLHNLDSYVASLAWVEARLGTETDAVIGSELFDRYVVEVNYHDKVLRLYDPVRYSTPENGCKLPLDSQVYPLVRAQIIEANGESIDATLVLDSGSQYPVLENWFAALHPGLAMSHTIAAPRAHGFSGAGKMQVGRARAVKLGSCTVDHPIVLFADAASLQLYRGGRPGGENLAGVIGTSILRKFNTVFNYQQGYVVFDTASGTNELDQYNMSGLTLVASGPGFHVFTVDEVVPNSPAERKGIRRGDVVESVNRVQASRLTLDDINRVLKRRGHVRLNLRRGDEDVRVKLKLRPLI